MPIFQEPGRVALASAKLDPKSIAVVGLSCRFPSEASTVEKFWDFILQKKSAYSEVSKRWNVDGFHHAARGKINTSVTKGAHFLDQDIAAFDAGFFNLTKNEALAIDPQQRFLLEVTYEAFENAGISLEKLTGSNTGCYVGAYTSDWRETQMRDSESAPLYTINGTGWEFLSNRISWFYDLHGPSMTIDTACSSSLVALHQACQNLQSGESNMAVVGGTSLLLNPDAFLYLSNQGFLAQDGRSKSFDAKGDGYGRGEGCAAVVLKRVDDAIRDGDPIRAVIRGSGVNSDGRTKVITSPSTAAQANLIRSVYSSAGVDMNTTAYVEAHGTGTSAGDPVELRAIAETIGLGRKNKLFVGSVKPNIGHLEAGAGLAGLIKSVLALEKGIVPPNILFDTPNPNIPFEKWNLEVPVKAIPWPRAGVRRISVNSFGVGGTNGHVIVDDAENYLLSRGSDTAKGAKHALTNGKPAASKILPKTRIFLVSAQDQDGMIRQYKALAAHLKSIKAELVTPAQQNIYLRNLAFTLGDKRSRLPWKSYIIASTIEELIKGLENTKPDSVRSTQSPRLGFAFTGQGAQWARMGIDLYQYKVFRESVQHADKYLKSIGAPWSTIEELERDDQDSKINLPEFSQPICTVLQIALVDLLATWNIHPASLTGHSSGEIGAAYALGALSRDDALKVAYWRGKLSASMPTIAPTMKGAMLAVGASEQQVNEWIADVTQGEINVACVNSGSSVTVSGDLAGVQELQSMLQEKGVFERRLKVETAYHSHHMMVISNDYLDSIKDIKVFAPDNGRRMYSSVPGEFVEPGQLNAVHWVRNLLSPVLFLDAMLELVKPTHDDGAAPGNAVDIVVEVGPHSALQGPIKQILEANSITGVGYQTVISRGKNNVNVALAFAGAMFTQGVLIDALCVNGDMEDVQKPQLLTNLPSYSWNHTNTFWSESRLNKQYRTREQPRQSLLGAPVPHYGESERMWRGYLRMSEEPWIRDHQIQSSILYPAAGYIAMAIEGAVQLADKSRAVKNLRLRDVQISVAAVMTEDAVLEVILQLRPHLTSTRENSSTWLEFTVSTASSDQGLRQNCCGLILIEYVQGSSELIGASNEGAMETQALVTKFKSAEKTCQESDNAEEFYEHLASLGLNYGPTFRNMTEIRRGKGESCCVVEISDPGSTVISSNPNRPHIIHPATLDAMFHAAFAATKGKNGQLRAAMVPTSIEELVVSADIPFAPGSQFKGYCNVKSAGFRDISANIHMLNEELNGCAVSVTGFTCTEVGWSPDAADSMERADKKVCSEVVWQPALEILSGSRLGSIIKTSTHQGDLKLVELIKLMIHKNPCVSIYEIGGANLMASRLFSSMAEDTFIEALDYTVSIPADSDAKDVEENVEDYKSRVSVKTHDINAGSDNRKADLIIVSRPADCFKDIDRALANIYPMLKPSAKLAIVDSDGSEVFEAALKRANFAYERCSQKDDGVLIVATAALNTNGSLAKEVIILESNETSKSSKLLADQINNELHRHAVDTKRVTWGAHLPIEEGKQYISLVELEKSLIEDLTEADFGLLKTLITKAYGLLWVTAVAGPASALITGLARVIRNENAGSQFRTLQLTALNSSASNCELIARVSLAKTEDSEFKEENGLILISRLVEDLPTSGAVTSLLREEVVRMPLTRSSKPQRLTVQEPGILDTLCFETDHRTSGSLNDDEVEIEVKASALNFRDVMIAMGQIADTALGVEASGVVLRVGKNVTNVKPGDRVCTMAHGAHSTNLRVLGIFCQILPDGLSFEEGASLTLVHATAYHALINLARIHKGQSILIHAAAGGVGQAALQLAKHFELEIFVTVGSLEKQTLVKDQYGIPDDHIFNSRNIDFAKGIKRVTNGRGVDVVLNSLAGEALRHTWYCLAPFGVFVEIGMKDILVNSRLEMQPFLKNSTFTFFNIQDMIFNHPDMVAEICSGTFDYLRRGITKPVTPLRAHPISEVENVFRTMQAGKHIGKIALSFDKNVDVPVLRNPGDAIQLDSNATYVLIGGLGGLGRSLSQLLVDNGARNLCFISRSGATSTKALDTVQALEAQGIHVRVYKCNVASSSALENTLRSCAKVLPPIKGCIQCAMVLRDTLFEKMTYQQWIESTRPKVQGSWNLHKHLPLELDFFIILSSFAGIFGNIGQSNYAAAGAYQDALASLRRSEGLPCVALDLGIMRDVGLLAELGTTDNLKDWTEPFGIREPTFHALIKNAITLSLNKDSTAQVVCGLATGGTVKDANIKDPFYFSDPRFSILANTGIESAKKNASANNQPSIASKISGAASLTEVYELIVGAMVEKVAKMMQTPTTEIDTTRPLYGYGVDSLVAIEMRNWVVKELKSDAALFEILSAVPMSALCQKIAEKCKILPEW